MLTATKRRKPVRFERSPANVKARRIIAKLEEVGTLLREWTDEHGEQCDCIFCGQRLSFDGACVVTDPATSDAAFLSRDFAGLAWAIRITCEMAEGVTLDPDFFTRK